MSRDLGPSLSVPPVGGRRSGFPWAGAGLILFGLAWFSSSSPTTAQESPELRESSPAKAKILEAVIDLERPVAFDNPAVSDTYLPLDPALILSRARIARGRVLPQTSRQEDPGGQDCRAFLSLGLRHRGAGKEKGHLQTFDPLGTPLEKQHVGYAADGSRHLLDAGNLGSRSRVTLRLKLPSGFELTEAGILYVHPGRRTAEYLDALDVREFELRGADYVHPRYRHGGLVTRREILPVEVYDYALVAAVERRLAGIDRRAVLRQLYARITAGLATDRDRHLAVLRFLHRAAFQNFVQPMYPDGSTVYDPLVLLELGDIRCGHVNRVAVDLFAANGIAGRIVQMGNHQAAEIHYDGGWHYFDGDIVGNGEAPRVADGSIPSLAALSRTPYAIDALSHYRELDVTATLAPDSKRYPSWYFFSREVYEAQGVPPAYYVKKSRSEDPRDRYFGWRETDLRKADDWQLHEIPKLWQPGAVRFKTVTLQAGSRGTRAVIEWDPAEDGDQDLLGYRVFVGTQSRGWHYQTFSGDPGVEPYWADRSGWRPEMYQKLFSLPPHDVALVTTPVPRVSLDLEPRRSYYVTVMPYDRHGETVGKQLYAMSEELLLGAR